MNIKVACHISSKGITVNSKKTLLIPSSEIEWKKYIYQSLSIEYSKFHKMDALAKMAICGLKVIEKEYDLNHFKDEEIALIFANKSSSYYSDNKHFTNYTKLNTLSPSDFVYTLPNILTGEIAILKKWYGENVFFIQEEFDLEFFKEQINFYFYKGAKACLCGWIESNNELEEAILFFVEKGDENLTLENFEKQIKA